MALETQTIPAFISHTTTPKFTCYRKLKSIVFHTIAEIHIIKAFSSIAVNMSDVIKSVLRLVVNKARSATASHLSDGDLTDERFREAIISDIDDIKSSLRGLARERLEGSLSFLKESI